MLWLPNLMGTWFMGQSLIILIGIACSTSRLSFVFTTSRSSSAVSQLIIFKRWESAIGSEWIRWVMSNFRYHHQTTHSSWHIQFIHCADIEIKENVDGEVLLANCDNNLQHFHGRFEISSSSSWVVRCFHRFGLSTADSPGGTFTRPNDKRW